MRLLDSLSQYASKGETPPLRCRPPHLEIRIVVNGVEKPHLRFGIFFGGTSRKNPFGFTVFYTITRSASHFPNRIGHYILENYCFPAAF